MKAIVYDKSHKPDHLKLQEIDKPIPRETEVLVKIHAVSVNAADYRSMQMGIVPKTRIYGSDIAGVVVSVGNNVKNLQIGDAVFGDLSASGSGGFAEYVTALETLLAKKPAKVPFEDAAALPMAALTALQALRDKGKVKQGQKVMIYGSGGGVGTFAVQLVKYFDAEVTAVSSTKNLDRSSALGADHVIDYSKADALATGIEYDLIVAINGSRPLMDYMKSLASGGRCVMVGGSLSQILKTLLLGSILSIGGKRIQLLSAKPNVGDLDFIIKLVVDGKIKPVIDRRYPLDETSEAIKYLKQGHAQGKVVISVL